MGQIYLRLNAMSLQYFGTDGVRGRALEPPLTLEETARWGRAWGTVAKSKGIKEMVVGWDPRCSSEPLAEAFLRGINGMLRAEILGIVPTPAVAWVTKRRTDSWGLMISASHNPPEDNGIKGFNGDGEKLSEEDEMAVERAFSSCKEVEPVHACLQADARELSHYIQHLGGITLPKDFKLVVDCAHGATAPWATHLLRGNVIWIGTPADGNRINVGVGSTHLETLQTAVRENNAQAGVAFDGDGDRCLLVDPNGEQVDGDQMLWLLAQDQKAQEMPIKGVVGTVMSNGGLENALKTIGIPLIRTPVGDKFMLRELAQRGWDLAAESSGHLIQKHVGPSGDGLATAIAVLRAILHKKPEERWSWQFRPWPLCVISLRALARKPIEECMELQKVNTSLEKTHGSKIRTVIRWSGTEPKLRLMVEAQESDLMHSAISDLERAASLDLGL